MSLVTEFSRRYPAPESIREFRFGRATLGIEGVVELGYSLDDVLPFVERIELPVPEPLEPDRIASVQPLVDLLHWVAGVSYYKSATPAAVTFAGTPPGPRACQLLEALYSEGLGEFAFENGIALPAPMFEAGPPPRLRPIDPPAQGLLVPVGGGKDSIVAIETLRALERPLTLFSVGAAAPIASTVRVSGLPWLRAIRRLDPTLLAYNTHGALNGHVPVTAIVSLVAALTAVLNDRSGVVMSNERSASIGNVQAFGIDVNHQFSKGLRVERLLRAAIDEAVADLAYFSLLRGASELAITRAFSDLPQYHDAFTSCNAVFRLDPSRRAGSWCADCPKCRFVFLALAPFLAPTNLEAIFHGVNLLDDPAQYDGFALLAAVGGNKPFECVGEEEEAVAAFRMLVAQPAWRDARVVHRFADEQLAILPSDVGRPENLLAWSEDHDIPVDVALHARAVLGA